MDQQGDAQADQIAEDFIPDLEPYSKDSASDKDGDEYASAETDECIVDETVCPSPKKIRTRSKSWKVNIPEPVMYSDPEDEKPHPRQRKRTRASTTPLRAGGTSKYFRRNSNHFPSIASKKLAVRRGRAGSRGSK